ncbi:MAG: DUF58 domain-containing protein [Candidatus Eisenbacteria bacterium]|nr:DUF58 domain-containing protein [Candidatus Eisenbacteria bacterium]
MIPREIIRKIRRIEIRTKRLVDEVFSGEYQSVFKGRGMEFSEVREYLPGDDVRTIDWNVTARTGHPFVKKFEEERELTIMFLVDASASGGFGTVARTKAELIAELCALLAFSATRNNDRVGLVIFTDRVEKVVPPRKGRTHVLRVVRELLFHRPEGRGTDIAGALEYLTGVVRRHAIVFLVSDFLAADYEKRLSVANRRYDLIAVEVADPREDELPRLGLVEMEDPESGERVVVDTGDRAFLERFHERRAREAEERRRLFRRLGVDSINVSTDRDYVEPLEKFFRTRSRRAGPAVSAGGRR